MDTSMATNTGSIIDTQETVVKCVIATQTSLSQLQTFSPKLCLELLPTLSPEQLDFELQWQTSVLGQTFDFSSCKPIKSMKITELLRTLTPNISLENDQLFFDCDSYQKLTTDFAYLIKQAEAVIAKLGVKPSDTDVDGDMFFDSLETPPDSIQAQPQPDLPEPVELLNVNFDNVHLESLLDCFQLSKIGSREVGYLGPTEFRYANITHPATPYPANETLDQIFAEISAAENDPGFNKENYTVLATLYRNGGNWLPYHSDSDNGSIICNDSKIYTVSFGAEREINFRSIAGPVTFKSISLPHGSVHVMTMHSQRFWEHSIPKHSATEPRLSLTFRKLCTSINTQHRPPPIRRPKIQPKPIPDSQTIPPDAKPPPRLLFLTDSIHKNFSVESFGSNVQCVKRVSWELHTIDKYEHLFRDSDMVFISCGVNDLSRYADIYNAANLIQFLRSRLLLWKSLYPHTTFVLNTILLTRFDWLNSEIRVFNNMLMKLSLDFHNVFIFDSWDIAREMWQNNFYILNTKGNGVHIHHKVSTVMHKCMVNNLGNFICGMKQSHFWPLRDEFRAIVNEWRHARRL